MTAVASPAVEAPKPAPRPWIWQPVYCEGKRKNGQRCGLIVSYRHDDYVAGTMEVMCHTCRTRRVVL
jgi:hypothetical protein